MLLNILYSTNDKTGMFCKREAFELLYENKLCLWLLLYSDFQVKIVYNV